MFIKVPILLTLILKGQILREDFMCPECDLSDTTSLLSGNIALEKFCYLLNYIPFTYLWVKVGKIKYWVFTLRFSVCP